MPHTSRRTPHTSLLTPTSLHFTPKTPRRTDDTGGLATWLARVPTEARRASSNRNVGGKAGKYSNRKVRLEEGGLGSISDTKYGRVQWEDMMDSTGPRNIFAIGIQRNTKTPMERLIRKNTKSNKNHSRTKDNNAQGTKANAKAETQIADGIVGPHAAWACAVQATGGERGLKAQKKDKRESTFLSEVACSIYS